MDHAARRIGALAAQLAPSSAESQARPESASQLAAHAPLGAHRQAQLLRSPTSMQAPHGVKVCVVGSCSRRGWLLPVRAVLTRREQTGAAGGIGQPLSLLLKLSTRIHTLNLYDVASTAGVKADISHINTGAKARARAVLGLHARAPDGCGPRRCAPSLAPRSCWTRSRGATWSSSQLACRASLA